MPEPVRSSTVRELFRFSPTTIFVLGFVPPLTSAILCIAFALLHDSDKISNYNWICGRAFLPSISRIINLPFERTLWQLFTFLHVPLRLVEIGVGFDRYRRLRNIHCRRALLYEFARYSYLICGVLELVFLIALSTVVERENGHYHVICFYIFGCFGLAFFVCNAICHSESLYYLNPYGRLSFNLKITFTAMYAVSIPFLFACFVLYWKRCILTGKHRET
ncbi:hypothetical protein L596_019375 [Steinernema carpocapsae]|uniref:CWH43-like N-terminal domain-containing protein n=1 Tax=Steinernema carpocapsae TaxID=34508 RepID=A0A4U5MQC4_STECR|nr:hypothetical protein L596_019375 [Steinernema carpocapsae]